MVIKQNQPEFRHSLLVLFFLFYYSATAQNNLLPGLIITPTGDSIKGYLDYRNWNKIPASIHYCKAVGQEVTRFTPREVYKFKLTGEEYFSAVVKVETSAVETGQLTNDKSLQFRTDTVFLRNIIEGSKSLYYLKTLEAKEQFYIRVDSAIELLAYKKYSQIENGQIYIKENNRYKGQLIAYLSNCPIIIERVKHIRYTRSNLQSLFKEYYNNCCTDTVIYQEPIRSVLIETGFHAGLCLSVLDFSGGGFDYLTQTGFNTSYTPQVALSLELTVPDKLKKWSLYNEISIQGEYFNGNLNKYTHENNYSITETSLGFIYGRLSNLVKYTIHSGFMSTYFCAGISNGLMLDETNQKKTTSVFYTTVDVKEGKALNAIRRHEQGIILGAGCRYKHFDLQLRFEQGNGMSNYAQINSRVRHASLMLGYRF
jgi:hypothetical protein